MLYVFWFPSSKIFINCFPQSLQSIHLSLGPGSPLRRPVDSILQRVPTELRGRMERRALPTAPAAPPSLKALVRLHKQVIKALQTLQRTQTQWGLLLEEVLHLEDVAANQRSREHRFKPSFSRTRSAVARLLYTPAIGTIQLLNFKLIHITSLILNFLIQNMK